MQIVCQENLSENLFALYEQLRLQHGALMWWPADTPFEVALGGILTQATSWRNEAGLSRFSRLARLRVKSRYRQRRYRVTQIAFLSPTNLSERFAPGQKAAGAWTPAQLLATSQTELEELLRPSRYYRAKAKKVRAFVEHLAKRPMHVMFEQALPELRLSVLAQSVRIGFIYDITNQRISRLRTTKIHLWHRTGNRGYHHPLRRRKTEFCRRRLYPPALLAVGMDSRQLSLRETPKPLHGEPAARCQTLQRISRTHRPARRKNLQKNTELRRMQFATRMHLLFRQNQHLIRFHSSHGVNLSTRPPDYHCLNLFRLPQAKV